MPLSQDPHSTTDDRRIFCLYFVMVVTGLLAACGSGNSSGSVSGGNPPPSPDFSLSVEEQTVTVQQGGAIQIQTVGVTPLDDFSGTIQFSISGLPSGVTLAAPGPYTVSVPGTQDGVSFPLQASLTSAAGTTQVSVTATSGSITHTATFSIAVAQAAPFTINVSPPTATLTPGTSLTLTISAVSSSIPPPQLGVALSNMNFPGVNIAYPQGFLTPSNPLTFGIDATALAEPLENAPLVLTASDSNHNSAIFTLPVTIELPFSANTTPTRSTFSRTDRAPTGMVYDQARKLLFVSVEILDEVVVLSSVDGHRVAAITVPYPSGVDESADGSAVYVVSPYFPGVTTIDPNILQVVGHSAVPGNVYGANGPPSFFQLATLSNGEVALGSGTALYFWDPATNSFTLFNQYLLAQGGLIARSADHSKVLFYGSSGSVYDVATNTFTPWIENFGANCAISPNGQEIVSVGLQGSPTIFYDSNLNEIATMQINAFPVLGVVYGLDGKHVYVLIQQTDSLNSVAAVIDTTSYSVAGLVPGFNFSIFLPFSSQWIATFATDETNMLFGATQSGVGFLDMSSPTSLAPVLPGPFQIQPTLASLTGPTPALITGAGFQQNLTYALYLGPPPSSTQSLMATSVSIQSNSALTVAIPAGSVAGSANATLTRSDGFFEVMPDAISFGPSVLSVDANAGSPDGGDTIQITGHGLSSETTQVTIGGQTAQASPSTSSFNQSGILTDGISVKTPPGTPGLADVTITNSGGSITIPRSFQYLNSVQVYPNADLFDDLAYDESRQLLYISSENTNQIQLFDLSSNQYTSTIPVGNSPTSVATTPDGALLATVNANDGTVSVIDLTKLQVVGTYPALTTADEDPGCGGAVLNIVGAFPHRIVEDVACLAEFPGSGAIHIINLDTGSISCQGVAGCDADGVDIASGSYSIAATPDGQEIFLASQAQSGGTVSLLNLNANTFATADEGLSNDAAANADGTVFAGSFGLFDDQLSRFNILAYEPYSDAGNESITNLPGEKLNPSGSLLFVPQSSGVDIFDVHTGRLAMHVALPDPLPTDTNAMVLDETGTKMFIISNTGLTIADLYQAPLSLATVNPSSGASGTTVTLRGSGFLDGVQVTFGTASAAVTFVDSNTLQVTVPPLPAGPVRISIANPYGSQYSFDAAFSVD